MDGFAALRPRAGASKVRRLRGIATRAFRQTFNLADHMKDSGANLENGLLVVDLKREVPEALKPRRIDIGSQGGRTAVGQDNRPEQIEGSANAA